MNSGIKLEEIKRLFNYLEENKTNNDLQIIMTTEGCHDLYELFINCSKYQKILEEIINKAIEYINNTDLGTLDKWKLQEILKGEENE